MPLLSIVAVVIACSGGLCATSTLTGLESVSQCQRLAPMMAGMSRNEPRLRMAERFGAQKELYFECRLGEEGEVLYRFSTSPLLADRFASAP